MDMSTHIALLVISNYNYKLKLTFSVVHSNNGICFYSSMRPGMLSILLIYCIVGVSIVHTTIMY